MKVSRAFLLSSLVVLTVVSASADVVMLKSGGKISGSVVSQDDRLLVLRTAYGTVTFEMADVAEVKYSTADEKKILADLAAIAPSDTAGRLKLARRATESGLDEAARRIYAQVLAVDPDQETARKALGYIKYGGEWVTPLEKGLHEGLVPYKGRWVTPAERDSLIANDQDRQYFAEFDLTPSEGYRYLDQISDLQLTIEPRGGYIVRRHVQTIPVKDKPYLYSVDALSWKRLGVFIGVSFIDRTRRRVPGFGRLTYTIFSSAVDTVGNRRPDKAILTGTIAVTPLMWEKKSDLKYWDTRINHSSYEKNPSDELKKQWAENCLFNYDGVLFVLTNRDMNVLVPPGVYYVEATLRLSEKEKKVGRYVQYAEPR